MGPGHGGARSCQGKVIVFFHTPTPPSSRFLSRITLTFFETRPISPGMVNSIPALIPLRGLPPS